MYAQEIKKQSADLLNDADELKAVLIARDLERANLRKQREVIEMRLKFLLGNGHATEDADALGAEP